MFGGVYDDVFMSASTTFFEQVKAGIFNLLVSPVLEDELSGAPQAVRRLYDDLAAYAESATLTREAVLLQEAYLKSGILSPKWSSDAMHVAYAVVHRCSLLVSWNFKHIVHYDKIALYNAINIVEGYGEIQIHSPQEIIRYDTEEI